MDPQQVEEDRRASLDRRRKSTNPLSLRSLLGGRRRTFRRDGEEGGYVDRYDYKLLIIVLVILVLCSFDAVATVLHLEEEVASELNPLMAYLMSFGPMKFFVVKYLLTSLGLIILVLHHSFPKVKFALFGVLICYSLIMLFHVFIFLKYW